MFRKKRTVLGVVIVILAASCAAVKVEQETPPLVEGSQLVTGTDLVETQPGAIVDVADVLAYPVVDTGQEFCYSDDASIPCPTGDGSYFGQDAQYQGNQPQYADNGDGTVTDLVTGLMWVKEPIGKVSFQQAVDGADSFSLAGYDDWRAPTIKELYSLMDFGGIDPSSMDANPITLTPFINTDYFGFEYGDTTDGSRVIDSQWVTSNIYQASVFNGQECFFGVNFADGRIKCYPTASNGRNAGFFVRYVRGGSSYGENQFIDKGDGTISDQATGLTWMRRDSGQSMNWDEALVYCEGLDFAGETDWRLPNAKELQSLVDYSRSPDTTNSAAIDPLFSSTSILNEDGQPDWPYMWSSTTHVNQIGYGNAVYISFGRAMGYMEQFGGWLDVHGAGAQRSDPKIGLPEDYPQGMGPQGDARRAQNYARCVSGGTSDEMITGGDVDTSASGVVRPPQPGQGAGGPGQGGEQGLEGPGGTPPQSALNACAGQAIGDPCSFIAPNGEISGACNMTQGGLACVP